MNVDRKMTRLKNLTDEMKAHRDSTAKSSAVRRSLMFELNREHGVTYIELAAACGLNPARITQEMAKEIASQAG